MFLTEICFPIAKLINLDEELLIMFEKLQIIYLAGGCFWGVEAYISRLKGVNQTEVGYANGRDLAPTYEKVCTGKTGHVECVKATYNPKIISLEEILEEYFRIIDPYAKNRQDL